MITQPSDIFRLNALHEFQTQVAKKRKDAGLPDAGSSPGQPFVPKDDTAYLRALLFREEANELISALEHGPIEEVLKEWCDVQYVLSAIAVIYDLPVVPAFNRVHENNMAKMDTGHFNAQGKLVKDKHHPKVNLSDLVN